MPLDTDTDSSIDALAGSPPQIIQGGMGAGVSDWRLARTVSQDGALGVVSGTGLDSILAARLQMGDVDGHIRRAMESFPFPEIAERTWERYYIEGGKSPDQKFKNRPTFRLDSSLRLLQQTVLANYVEVWLAKEGHDRPVGINYLEKIQLPHLPSIYGAMLAGVDYVLMGAGIPIQIPAVLDLFSNHEEAVYTLYVENQGNCEASKVRFDPREVLGVVEAGLKRPDFIAIIAYESLAKVMTKKAKGKVNGFVIEGPTAGGHNAPPREKNLFNERGEPLYGEKDVVDLSKIASYGLPFWLAGGKGSPQGRKEALLAGGAGIQVGSLFALCDESGLDPIIKRDILEMIRNGDVDVYTDARASPTGFPFKVIQKKGTLSDDAAYAARPRICDLGYLRSLHRTENGSTVLRCPSEPQDTYAMKGGQLEDTIGRKCVCNGLMAAIGMGQARSNGYVELPILTSGDAINEARRFLRADKMSYSALDVLAYLRG
ncbi:MAG: nitronate monooxygenase [Nanoarchaeota archaeon]